MIRKSFGVAFLFSTFLLSLTAQESIDPSLFARLRIAGNLHLEGRLGYAIDRKYDQYAADQTVPFRISIIKFGDERITKNIAFGSGMFASLRLVYNMPLGEKE